MPTYEYRCPEGHEFENFVLKISSAKAELPCPTCGAAAPRRMSAGSGLLFKGSGFYITDYGKDGKKDQRAAAKAVGEKAGATADGGKSSTTADAKPAAASGAASATPAASTPKPAATPSTKSTPKSGSSE